MSLETLLRRDRWLALAALGLLLLLAWGYVLSGAGMGMDAWDMTRMPSAFGLAPRPQAWSWGYALLMLAMWWSMMLAMMLPSAAPVLLLVAALNRRAQPGRQPFGSCAGFVAGYLLAWGGFSLLAVLLQWLLMRQGLLTAMLGNTSRPLAGVILLVAGAWQFSPLKHACLHHCQAPVQFLVQARQRGCGSLCSGARHGLYCLGCCWALMALLFAGGVMNLYWIIGLTLYVMAEKLLPGDPWLSRLAGAGLLLGGLWLLAA